DGMSSMALSLEQMVVDPSERVRDRYYGKYRGIVRDIGDPEGLGRITASVPSVLGDEDSAWALPAVAVAGAGYGLVLLPRVGDGVWIEFEAGDVSLPIWTGAWWGSNEIPDAADQQRTLLTPEGLKLVLDDSAKEIRLEHPDGPKITITGSDIT